MLKSGDVGSGIFQSSLLLESKENVLDFSFYGERMIWLTRST